MGSEVAAAAQCFYAHMQSVVDTAAKDKTSLNSVRSEISLLSEMHRY